MKLLIVLLICSLIPVSLSAVDFSIRFTPGRVPRNMLCNGLMSSPPNTNYFSYKGIRKNAASEILSFFLLYMNILL